MNAPGLLVAAVVIAGATIAYIHMVNKDNKTSRQKSRKKGNK